MITPSSTPSAARPDYSKLVFLVGVFRSGTSLLYSLLNQHPQMALMYECDIWDFPELLSGVRFRRNWLERQEFYNRALSRHQLIVGGSLRGLEQVREPEELYRTFSRGRHAAISGEKSPFYCARLQQLARRYPGCSFILLWRDPIEIYRSVVRAGVTERFFRRRGMLSRLVFYQEQLIRQTAALNRAGVKVRQLTYADLVDRTEEVCRNLCQFLEIEFDPRMLDLAHADFSAVFRSPHHNHLRRGIIERQQVPEPTIDPRVVGKLERFRARWSRMSGTASGIESGAPEPSFAEHLYHRGTGAALCAMDNAKRALFEFLPLAWLRAYRETASWLFVRNGDVSIRRPTIREQFARHRITIIVSWLLLGGAAAVHYFTNPHFIFIPFYLIPCAMLTLIINRRWGTFAALAAAVVGPLVQRLGDPGYASVGVLLWNSTMRFLLYQTFVLLLDRVRVEVGSSGASPPAK